MARACSFLTVAGTAGNQETTKAVARGLSIALSSVRLIRPMPQPDTLYSARNHPLKYLMHSPFQGGDAAPWPSLHLIPAWVFATFFVVIKPPQHVT